MTVQEQFSPDQTWQDVIDPRFLGRLLQRATQPGVIGTQLAETVLSRFRNTTRSPRLLAELLQRYGGEEFFHSEHIPIVYAQPPQIVQSTATSPVPSTLTRTVRETERTERPIIVGALVWATQQEQNKHERQEKLETSAPPDRTQSTPVVSSHRRRTGGADEQRDAAATVVQPTAIGREGFSSTPNAASRETLTVIPILNQTFERRLVALPSVRSETGAAPPQQQRESGARLSTTPREAAQSQVFLAADRPFAEIKPQVPQRPVVATASRLSTPPPLTLVRTTPHSPISGGGARPMSQLEPYVRPLDGSPHSRVISHSDEMPVRSRRVAASPTSAPLEKESSTGARAGMSPARDLRELAEKVQQKLDIEALAEKVQRQLRRRLVVEHERRGRTRWT